MVPTVDGHSRTIGIAIDTFLFSRIGAPLFHRYRAFDRLGSHPDFRGPYMSKLFTFLKESDTESIRRSHRRRAKEIAVSMSKNTSESKNAPTDTTLSGRSVQRTVVSKITGRDAGQSLIPTAGGRPRSSASSIYGRSVEEDTVQALMDLSLPRFAKLGDGVLPRTEPWPVTEKSPASPVSARDRNRTRTPSPCFELDDISSASSVGDTSTNDYKLTLSYDKEDSITPVGSIVFSSEEDVPLSSGQEDRRKVRKRDPHPGGQPRPTDVPEYVPTPRERPVDVPIYKPTPRERPVDEPTLRVWPVDVLAYEPTPRERLVDDQTCEPRTRVRPIDGPTLRERPVDVLAYKPTPRERPVGEKPYGPRPRERPVNDPMLKGRPVDVLAHEPTPRERPVDDEAYEPTPEGRPVDDPTLRRRPLDEAAHEPTPRERPVDNPNLRERPVDDQESGPMTSGGPADGPKSGPRPKETPVDPKTVPLLYKPPPPSDLPEWSDSEVMPLIIIENSSGVANPRTPDGLIPVGSDILLPQSPKLTSLEDQGVLSAPLSPNRVRKGHSQDMPAEGIYLMGRRTCWDST